MFIVRFIGRRLFSWLRGRNPFVSRLFVVASVAGWLWHRYGSGRVITLDARESYSIDVGPPGAFERSTVRAGGRR